MSDARYLLIGGEVFDRAAGADPDQQHQFLRLLFKLRRDPLTSAEINIDKARLGSRHGLHR